MKLVFANFTEKKEGAHISTSIQLFTFEDVIKNKKAAVFDFFFFQSGIQANKSLAVIYCTPFDLSLHGV